ncbi:site-specific integrase [Paracnuella aquatica]|uniref:site-specific integrase n=1 Tax=Paracnuella aquatica TaxID=2268757 RepID=UPI000DEF341C|nr:site-specific integrase [Paracnuella aquatica]RPD50638.1 hypothetical protein DRJ53_06860 [Paracnuella aquatica]
MSQHLHVLFCLNKAKQNQQQVCPLIIRLTWKKQRKQVATGFQLSVRDWGKIEKGVRLTDEYHKTVWAYMQAFRANVLKVTNQLELEGRMDFETCMEALFNRRQSLPLIKLLDQFIQDFQKRTEVDRSKETLKKYKCLKGKVQDFIQHHFQKQAVIVDKLDQRFIIRFSEFLLIEQRIQHNTVAKYCRNLKRVMNYAKEQGLIDKQPFDAFKMGYKDIERTYLTSTELALLERKACAIRRLEIVKDMFLFQCYTGLAFTDMQQLKPVHIIEGVDGKPWLYLKRQKTKSISMIPLLPQPQKLLAKYGVGQGKNQGLLPVMSNQKFNAYLKEVATVCGIDKELTSHAGRRTFATTVALGNGISIESISKMLGHKSIRMTSMYALITDLKVCEEMTKLAEKLA